MQVNKKLLYDEYSVLKKCKTTKLSTKKIEASLTNITEILLSESQIPF